MASICELAERNAESTVFRIDELVKSQISDGFEKSPQARRANPEE
jgi:hypothetical protein